jgi:PilZ domain
MAIPQLRPYDAELNLTQAQARLDQLARYEWWRWSIAFVVMLALTFGLFVLSVPGGRDWVEQTELNIGLRALLALVLLFDVFVVHQQVLITRLRRDLATQLGVIATLETLKNTDEANSPQTERRNLERTGLDRRLRVNALDHGNRPWQHGRIRDISEAGIGAVIPCSLRVGDEVALEFSLGDGQEGSVTAVVCHRQGFYYGFEFVSIGPSLRKAIARFRSAAMEAPVS